MKLNAGAALVCDEHLVAFAKLAATDALAIDRIG